MYNMLTERQREVLVLVAKGYKNEQIADELIITLSTVKAHVSEIYRTLNVSGRVQASILGIKLGIISLDEI